MRIDLARQPLSVLRAGHEIGSTVILFGANRKPTPTGVFPVLEKAVVHRSTLYDAEMPFMLRLKRDDVAIHARDVRKGTATHGGIAVPEPFARRLHRQIHVSDHVAITWQSRGNHRVMTTKSPAETVTLLGDAR